MEIKGKVHCFFEQSGTFKYEFIKLGISAEDYDIQNNFGQTDHVVDLFAEIEKAYLMGIIFQVKPEKYGLFSLKICGCPYPLNTVHKLQHALRLCGIDKTIEL